MLHKIPFQPDFPHLKLMQLSPWTKTNTCFLCYYPCQEENIFPLLHFVPNTVWDFVRCPIQLWCALFMVVSHSQWTVLGSFPYPSLQRFGSTSPVEKSEDTAGWRIVVQEGMSPKSAALLNDEEADSNVENYGSTVSPEDNLIVWQGLLPVNPHGGLAISHLLRNPF